MNIIRVPKGSIRRTMRKTRKLRSPMTTPAAVMTADHVRDEIRATIPVYDVEAGQRELAEIHARAARNR